MNEVSGRPTAVAAFWDWWGQRGRGLAESVIGGGPKEDLVAEMSAHIAAIGAGLQWDCAPGPAGGHLLVVTAAGDPELRAPARAWLRAAVPAPDWSYADLRQPIQDAADTELEFAGRRLRFGDFVVAAHRGNTAIDVAVQHPVFMDIGEEEAAQLTYLALDSFLGEEMVETWIGEVSWPGEPPLDAFPLQHLRTAVADFAAGFRTAEGEPQWVVLQGTGPSGSPVHALAQVPLRQITFPLFDTHVAVTVPYADRTPDGLPGPGSLDALRGLEDRLSEVLGSDGRIVAHQSSDGVRLLHAYVDGTSEAADRVAATAAEWDQGDAQTVVTPDPGWALVNHLAG